MAYPYTGDPDGKRIRITDDSGIDAGRLIAFAQSREPEFPGAFGDDHKGGLMREQRPRWSYLQQYEQVRVDADFTSRIVDIVHESFDLAIRVGPLSDSTLAARKLGELCYGLFASPDYLARRTAPVRPADLSEHGILAFADGSHQATLTLTQNGQQDQIKLISRLKANNVFAVRDAAVAGLGAAQLPLIVASPSLRDRTLRAVLADCLLPAVPVHAVFASARYVTPKVRGFIDLAVDAMRASELGA